MKEPEPQDPKTVELFARLDLAPESKRQEFLQLSRMGPSAMNRELPAHFRLDSLTSTPEEGSDAKLA